MSVRHDSIIVFDYVYHDTSKSSLHLSNSSTRESSDINISISVQRVMWTDKKSIPGLIYLASSHHISRCEISGDGDYTEVFVNFWGLRVVYWGHNYEYH